MKLVFLLMIVYTQIFCGGAGDRGGQGRGRSIRKQEYYYKDFYPEEGRYGKQHHVGTKIYDEEGNAVEERRMYYGDIDEIIKFTFDEKNRVKVIDVWNEIRKERKRTVYHYQGDKVAEKSIYKGEQLVDKEVNIYDEDGNLMKVENKRGELTGYLYDKKGRVVMKSDELVKNYYTYDDNDNVVKEVCEIEDILIYCREYTYDEGGNVIKLVETTPKSYKEQEQIVKESFFKYNSKGDRVEEKWKENDSLIWCIKRLENTYNEDGDIVEVKEYETGESGKERPSREHYYRYEYESK